jgi:hypothetical protein
MSTIATDIENHRTDSVDFIIEKVTLVLLKKQSVSFEKLRKLTLLSSSVKDSREYAEIVVLSIIKYLELDSAFKEEIKNNTGSYRLFNALNLNDDKVNEFFVEFISVMAPELCSALSAVLAQLAIRLAERNKSKYSGDRLARLQERINIILENAEDRDFVDEAIETSPVLDKKPERRKVRRASFADYILGQPAGTIKAIKEKSASSKSEDKQETIVIRPKVRRIETKGLNISGVKSTNSETASQTSARIAKSKGFEKREIPDVDSDVDTEVDYKRKGNSRKIADDEVSSFAF